MTLAERMPLDAPRAAAGGPGKNLAEGQPGSRTQPLRQGELEAARRNAYWRMFG